VEADDEDGVKGGGGHGENEVPVHRCADEMLAEAGELKDGLDDDGTGHQSSGSGAEVVQHGQAGELEGMAEDDGHFGRAFGPGGADEILGQGFPQTAPGEPGDVGAVN